MPGLNQLAEQNLEDSGLTLDDVFKLGWKVLRAKETKKLGRHFDELPSLYIPYFHPIEQKQPLKCLPHLPPLFQVRYLKQAVSFATVASGGSRYVQSAGSGVGAYWMPGMDWKTIATDVSRSLIITEGEKKAIKANLAGFNAIALGGVESFSSKKEGLELSKDLELVDWDGRMVYVCYDADIMWKQGVQRALRRLADVLTLRGASVHAVYLPDVAGESKTALDNFLRIQGRESLVDALDEARNHGVLTNPRSRALFDLNEKAIYIEHPSHIIDLRTGASMAVKTFVGENYADHQFSEEKADEDGVVQPTGKMKSASAEWMRWKGKHRAASRTYLPGQQRIIETPTGMQYNSWQGLAVKPVKGDIKPWLAYIDWICGGDKELARHLHNWIGYPLKHLGTKMYTALVLWSVTQGTGKTLLGELLSDIYGASTNYATVTEDELASPYNSYIVGKQFILADECTGNDHRAYANKLKRMVTQTQVRVSEKYVPAYSIPDYANWLFTSNQPDAIFLEDGDRRFIVVELMGGRMPVDLFEPLSGKAGRGLWRKHGGMAHVLHFYQHEWDYRDFDPTTAAPMTAAKEEMLESGRSVHGAWVAALKRDPQSVLKLGGMAITKEWLTVSELLAVYEAQHGGAGRLTTIGLGKELKKQGFVKSPCIYTHNTTQRYVLVSNIFKWANSSGVVNFTPRLCKEICQHLEEEGEKIEAAARPKAKKY